MKTKFKLSNRILSLVLTFVMVLGMMPITSFTAVAATTPTAYDGVPVTPTQITSSNYLQFGLTDSNWSTYNGYYGIRNAKELYGFANLVNGMNGYCSHTSAVLLQDIVVNETVSADGAAYGWTPIGLGTVDSGTGAPYYTGTFDGNGHTISGLYASGEDHIGLFACTGYSNSAVIKNVIIKNSYFSGSNYVGGIVGYMFWNNTTVSNCKIDSDVTVQGSGQFVGGIVGGSFMLDSVDLQYGGFDKDNQVNSCVNFGTVKTTASTNAVGGIAGAWAKETDYQNRLITVTNSYYLSGTVSNSNGTVNWGCGTYASGTGWANSTGCTALTAATDSHTCVSVEHKETLANCTYPGLSNYSFCLICGEVTSGTKTETDVINDNHCYTGGDCVTEETCVLCGINGNKHSDIHASSAYTFKPNETDNTKHDVYRKCCDVYVETTEHGQALTYTNADVSNHNVYYACCGAFKEITTHNFVDSVCEQCKYLCTHSKIENEKCSYCGEGTVRYLHCEWNGTQVVEEVRNSQGMPDLVSSSTTTMSNGWYMVSGEVTAEDSINISGTVHLILNDGAVLNAPKGICLYSGNTLYIYATSDDLDTMGKLNAVANYSSRAGIGSQDNNKSAGTLVINGGNIIADAVGGGAGIGGYSESSGSAANNGFNLTVNGGYIQAIGGQYAAGIGTGSYQNGGKVTINGGTVIAKGGRFAAGIGGGNRGGGLTVTVNGGNINAIAGYYSAAGNSTYVPPHAIGRGAWGSNGSLIDGNGNAVSLKTLTLNGAGVDTAINSAEGIAYGVNDVYTLDTNKLYFYLSSDVTATSITADETVYDCKVGLTYYPGHDYVDATCKAPQTCTRCGHTVGDALGHNYVDGICTVCGIGEADGIYYISTAEQLMKFADYVNAGNQSADAVLMADIDLTGYAWTTICETGLYYSAYGTDLGYSGTFDGNGHVIKNITVTSSTTRDASCGLFGTVSGTIKHLGIENFTFVDGGKDIRTGAIVGQLITANGKVSNCYVKNATINPGAHVTGGIAGCVYDGTIENCYVVESTITGSSNRYGHIVGDSRGDGGTSDRPGTVTNCYTDNATIRSNNVGNVTNCATKNTEAFASGEVTYLLNGSKSDGELVWYQTLGTDAYPQFTGSVVYYDSVNGYNNHIHNWTYTKDGNKITATCDATGCTNTDGGYVTIAVPSSLTYTGSKIEAVVENTLTTGAIVNVEYSGSTTGGYPVNAGDYTAKITLDGNEISVEYTIAKADATAPTGLTAVYGQTLANVSLPDGWTWLDSTASVGEVGNQPHKANYAGDDNYNAASNVDVTVAVSQSGASMTAYANKIEYIYGELVTITVNGITPTGEAAVSLFSLTAPTTNQVAIWNGDTQLTEPQTVTGDALTFTLPTLDVGNYTLTAKFTGNENMAETSADVSVIINKAEPTVETPTNLTATYGDTLADVTLPTADNGKWTWTNEGTTSVGNAGTQSHKATFTPTDATNYKTIEVDVPVEVAKANIDSVSFVVTVPEALADKQTTVKNGTGYTAAIEWNTTDTKFGFNTAYTATVKLTADSNHKFADELSVDGWNVALDDNNTVATLTNTFDATRKAKLTELTSAPADKTLTGYYTAVSGAIAELPNEVTYTIESGNATVAIEWTCDNYNSATKANNTFKWSVKDGELDNYDVNNIETSGTITVTNVDALPVTNTGSDTEITYNGNTYDVSKMFTKDENAGEESYEVVVLGTEGEGAATLGADGKTLTITKAGVITIKMTTAANDPYAAGSVTATLTVNKANAAVTTAPTANDLTYTGSAQALVNGGTSNDGKVVYSLSENGQYTEAIPTGTNAGKHTVWYYVIGDNNHSDSTKASVEVTIAKANAVITVDTTPIVKTYGDIWELPTATSTFGTPVADKKVSEMVNAGTYTVTYTVEGTSNYNGDEKTVSVTINPAKVTKPANDTTVFAYNGSAQTYGVTETADYTVTNGTQTAANEDGYTVIISLKDKDNTVWDDGTVTDLTHKFKINRKAIETVVGVTAPVATQTAQTTVSGENYSGTVKWNPDATTFGYYTAYTATVTLTADTNYKFADSITLADYDVSVSNNGNTLTLTRTFEKTAKAKITSVKAPTVEKLAVYGTLDDALNAMPKTIEIETEAGKTTLPITWEIVGEYDQTPEVTNTFKWTANAGDYDANGKTTSGTLDVDNADALGVSNSGTPAEITYDRNTFDVSTMFTKDTNAGEASYEIVVLGTEGEGTATLGEDGKTLTITKAGVITVKMTTRAIGAYAEGSAQTTLTVKLGTGVGNVTIESWTYGETAKTPVVTSETNGTDNVTYLYESTDGKGYNSNVAPTAAGAYKVTATFAATDLYAKTGDSTEFTVEQAEPTVKTAPTATRIQRGKKLEASTIKGGEMTGVDGNALEGTFTWKAPETVMDTKGDIDVVVVFTPNDTANYKTVEITISVEVYSNALIIVTPTYYDVTFDTNGAGTIAKQTVRRNSTATEPAAPVKDGYTFGGWYTDEECTKAYDFDTKVTKDITLYAKWTENKPATTDPCDGTAADNCPSLAFSDLDTTAWYHTGVDYVLNEGMMNGMGGGIFAPNGNLSRAMLVTILWRLEGKPVTNYAMTFEDVDAESWYGEAVRWAASEGIVEGYSDKAFGPNDDITREQLATILYRYEQYKGGGFVGAWMFRMDYVDLADVSDWAYEAMCWMNMNGIVNGKPGKVLDPKGTATRAEAAAMLNRYCEKEENK